jgi:hypothetical protein
MDLVGFFSKLLIKCGMTEYVKRAEFSAHIAWGLFFGSLGYFVHWLFFIGWTAFTLWDEFYCDEHYRVFFGGDPTWRDLLWDLGSKLFGVAGFSIWIWIR